MSRSAIEYLRHILDEAAYLINTSKSLTFDAFVNNATYCRAFTRSIEIIGEAAKQISDDLKQKYPRLDWRGMAGMRDRLIHAYFGVDYEIVWDVIQNKIPSLHDAICEIINQEETIL